MSGAKYDVAKVKRWLSEYRENEKEMDDQFERLERMQARLESCSAPEITDMPRAPGYATDKMSMLLARKVDLENSLGIYAGKQQEYLERIEYVVSKLPRSTERVIIRRRYEDGDSWEDISFALYGDQENYLDNGQSYSRKMFRTHGDAILFIARYFAESGDSKVSFFQEYVPKHTIY